MKTSWKYTPDWVDMQYPMSPEDDLVMGKQLDGSAFSSNQAITFNVTYNVVLHISRIIGAECSSFHTASLFYCFTGFIL